MKPSSATGPTLPPNYQEALFREAIRRNNLFTGGVLRYLHSPLPGGDTTEAESGLCFYPSPHAQARRRPVVFCIPSLVNRHYILDINAKASFVGHLNAAGFDCIVMRWPLPTEADSERTTADYALWMLEQLQANWAKIDRPLIALGYCMGGLLALALTQLFERVQGMVLLATPWDYSKYPLAKLFQSSHHATLEKWVEAEPLFAPESVQALLTVAHTQRIYERFSRFAIEPRAEVLESFVALEHWANDGVAITRAVARECLIEWPRENTLLQEKWRVGGEVIRPSARKVPTLLAIPAQDHIVPASVALPLAAALPDATRITPQAGHVGMIAGLRRHELWHPLAEWLQQRFAG